MTGRLWAVIEWLMVRFVRVMSFLDRLNWLFNPGWMMRSGQPLAGPFESEERRKRRARAIRSGRLSDIEPDE